MSTTSASLPSSTASTAVSSISSVTETSATISETIVTSSTVSSVSETSVTESATVTTTSLPATTSLPTTVSSVTSKSTSTTTSATPTGPSIKETVGDWTFQGCWTETTEGRALSASTYASDDMTLESCAKFCSGHTYFGVEYGRECYCGDTLAAASVEADAKDCSFLCPGDKFEYCGAGMRLELYKFGVKSVTSSPVTTTSAEESATSETVSSSAEPTTSTSVEIAKPTLSSTVSEAETSSTADISSTSIEVSTVSTESSVSTSDKTTTVVVSSTTITTSTTTKVTSSASPTPTGPIVYEGNSNFTYYACVTEPSAGRLMDDQIFNDGVDMTIEACLRKCYMFDYAGVEYGRECWCGNTLNLVGNAGATPGKNVTDSQCDFLCPGDNNVFCGAGSKMNLYKHKDKK